MSTRHPIPAAPGPLHGLQVWLGRLLGSHYAQVIDVADRTAVAFVVAFAGQLVIGEQFDWKRAAVAGVAAAISLAKSLVVTAVTGDPALSSLTSRTIRARRDTPRPRVQHQVPVRKPRKVTA